MRSIVRKQEIPSQGTTVREKLRAMDDSAVVTAFLGGERRITQADCPVRDDAPVVGIELGVEPGIAIRLRHRKL